MVLLCKNYYDGVVVLFDACTGPGDREARGAVDRQSWHSGPARRGWVQGQGGCELGLCVSVSQCQDTISPSLSTSSSYHPVKVITITPIKFIGSRTLKEICFSNVLLRLLKSDHK